jgi:hypothetical protein
VGLVLGIGRRKSHRELARNELNESLDHFMQAATHMAGGVGAKMGPGVSAARGYVKPTAGRMRDAASHGWESTIAAIAPLASAAMDGARSAGDVARMAQFRKQREAERRRKRWSMMARLLGVGAAAGAAGALILRRRKQQWEEYDPTHALEPVRDDAHSAIDSAQESINRTAESGASAAGRAADRVGGAAGKMAAKADDVASEAAARAEAAKDKTASMTGSAAEGARRKTDEATDKAEDLIGRSTPSRNTRS